MSYNENKQPIGLDELTELADSDIFVVQKTGEVVKKITKENALKNLNVDWGNIQGDIQNQTDLQNQFNTKQNSLVFDEDIGYFVV